jgi:hypothetical protein
MASHDSFEQEPRGKEPQGGRGGGDRGKTKWKLSEINTRAVSRGQNELVSKLNISICGVCYEVHVLEITT